MLSRFSLNGVNMTETANNTTESLDTVLPVSKEPITIGGKSVTPKVIKVSQVGPVLRAIRPFNATIKTAMKNSAEGNDPAKNFDVLEVLEHHADNLIELVSTLTGEDKKFIGDLDLDDMIKITTAVMEVNLDFFIRKVLPLLSGEMARLGSGLLKATPTSGQTSSSN